MMWTSLDFWPVSPAHYQYQWPDDDGDVRIFDPRPQFLQNSTEDEDDEETEDLEDEGLQNEDFDDDDFDDDFEDDFEDELEEELERELQEELADDNLNGDASGVEVDPDDAFEADDF